MAPARTTWVVLLLLAPALSGCFGPDGKDAPAEKEPTGGFSDKVYSADGFDMTGPYARVREPGGPWKLLPGEVTSLVSDLDSEPISVGWVRPDVPEGTQVPIILHASPYLPPLVAGSLGSMEAAEIPSSFLVENFVPHGYAVAFVSTRGTGASGGCYDFFGPEERADLDQAATWLAEQRWASGAVGVIGGSLGAMAAWELAGSGNPHVRTIVPVRSETDLYSWLVRNGTLSPAANPLFAPVLRTFAETGQWQWQGMERGGAAYAPPADRLPSRACDDAADPVVPLTELSNDPSRPTSGYLAERDLRVAVEDNYDGSVLYVHGLRDAFAPGHMHFPWSSTLGSHNITVKHLIGQWAHDQPDHEAAGDGRRWDWAEMLLGWFDYWLKGDKTVDLGPRVEVADSSGKWRREEAWPPGDVDWASLALGADGTAGGEVATAGSVTLRPDPKRMSVHPFAGFLDAPSGPAAETWAACETCVVFVTEPAGSEQRFAGLPRVPMTATPSGPGGSITAYLFVEDADALRRPVGWGQIDLRFADGGETARPVEAGAPLKVKLEMEPLDVVVPSGSRLVLSLSQGGYGDSFFYYRATQPTYPIEVRLGDGASALELPIIERAPDVFFVPAG